MIIICVPILFSNLKSEEIKNAIINKYIILNTFVGEHI